MPLLDANGLNTAAPVEYAELGTGRAVAIAATVPVAALLPHLDVLDVVAIDFPAFTDGRGFSLAQQLRAAGYRGQLIARGELLPDQFAFALDCGFDAVEISDERLARQPVAEWLAALDAITVSYQPNTRITDIFARRRAARAAT